MIVNLHQNNPADILPLLKHWVRWFNGDLSLKEQTTLCHDDSDPISMIVRPKTKLGESCISTCLPLNIYI